MIKGLIFDVDGTLIDSIGDIHYSLNLALRDFGFNEVDYDFVKLNTGRGFRVLIQDCLPNVHDDKLIDQITESYSKHYGEHYKEKTRVYDGVHDTLRKLQELGFKMGVNSNKKDKYTKDLISSIFPDIRFIAVYGERTGIKNKPDPSSTNDIIRLMNLKKEEVLYVGDSEVDIRTSKNAKLNSIGCKWGFRKEETLKEEGATYIIDKPEEIIRIVTSEYE